MKAWELLGKKRPALWTIKELHAQGLTDQQIADRMGWKRSSVNSWRQRHGLPCNKATKFDKDVHALKRKGFTNEYIAARLGLTQKAVRQKVYYMRQRGHLPYSWKTKHTRGKAVAAYWDRWKTRATAAKVRELHAKGMTDAQIGNAMEIDHKLAGIYRWRLELKPNRPPTKRARIAEVINRAHARGDYARNCDMAERFGTSEKTIAAFRHQLRAAGLIPDDRPPGWRITHALDGVPQPSRRPVPLPGGISGDGSGNAAHGAD